jgi:hypothetical protein
MRKNEEVANPNSCFNRAGDDELMFVLLARDPAAQVAILAWIQERIRLGLNTLNDQKMLDAIECAALMEEQRKNILK